MTPLTDFLYPVEISPAESTTYKNAFVQVSCAGDPIYTSVIAFSSEEGTVYNPQVSVPPLYRLLLQYMYNMHIVSATVEITVRLCEFGIPTASDEYYRPESLSQYAYIYRAAAVTQSYDVLFYDIKRAGTPFEELPPQTAVRKPLFPVPQFVPDTLNRWNTFGLEMLVQGLDNGSWQQWFEVADATDMAQLWNPVNIGEHFCLFEYRNEYNVQCMLSLPGELTENLELETDTAIMGNGVTEKRVSATLKRQYTFRSASLPDAVFKQARLLLSSPVVRLCERDGDSWAEYTTTEIIITEIKSENTLFDNSKGKVVEFSFV